MTVKINGVNITPLTTNTGLFSTISEVDKMSEQLSKECVSLDTEVRAIALLSDIKTVESFGYRSTENVGETIVNAAKAVWEKIIAFIKKIINFITSVVEGAFIKVKVKKLLEKVDGASVFAASADFQIEWPTKDIDEINRYMQVVKKYLPIIKSSNNSEELKELFMVSNKLVSGNNLGTVTVDEAFKRLGLKAFKGGTFGGDGINRSFSKEVHEWLIKLQNGSSEYLFLLKQSNDLAKISLQESLELAKDNNNAKKANSMQAAIRILNTSSRLYTKYVTAALGILETVYSVQCFAQPGTPAYEEWLAKQKRNRTILIIAGVALAAAGTGVALATNPATAGAIAGVARKVAGNSEVRNLAKNTARSSVNTASSNVSRKVTNQIMDSVYSE